MPRWPTSLRARLTLLYTGILTLPLVLFAVGSYLVFSQALVARTDLFIGDALTAFSRELVAERRTAGTATDALRTTVDEVRFRDLHIAVFDTSGAVVAMSAPAEADDPNPARPTAATARTIVDALRQRDLASPQAITVAAGGGAYRVMARPLALTGGAFRLTGSYSLRDIEAVLARIREMFVVAIPLLIAVAAVGGSLLAKRSLAPVAHMAGRAAEISASNLHERLPVEGGDELVGLAEVVNGLLDRLEHAFSQQRRFVADASHELRTPAAIVRTEADVTLSREHRDEEEYRASMTVVQDAARRLTRIVDDLFLLARADAGHLVMRAEPLYLEEVVHDAARAVRSVADAHGVRVELGTMVEAPFHGDPDLLGRVVLNLLDNAIKYSPSGSVVTATVERDGPDYAIRVSDSGSGIPTELQERVFERFYRVDAARSRSENSSTSGAGLGLSIARRIAEMHGGGLSLVESRSGRTVFRVALPAAAGA